MNEVWLQLAVASPAGSVGGYVNTAQVAFITASYGAHGVLNCYTSTSGMLLLNGTWASQTDTLTALSSLLSAVATATSGSTIDPSTY